MSVTPVTPTTSIARHAVSTLKKQKRKRYENDDAGIFAGTTGGPSGDALSPASTEIVEKVLKDAFGEDSTWYGSQVFAHVTSQAGRFLAQAHLCLWLVFATAFDHVHQFGAQNAYSLRRTEQVGNFVVEQLGIRPSGLDRFLAGGKTHRFLMTFDKGNLANILDKFPRGWIKLAHGIGFRITSPADSSPVRIPITITNVPLAIPIVHVRLAIQELVYVESVVGLQHVAMPNGIKLNRVDGFLTVVELDGSPVSSKLEKFTVSLKVDGFEVELTRKQACVTCSDEDHWIVDCPVRQKLVVNDTKGWSFVSQGVAPSEDGRKAPSCLSQK
ncbi:hypothetical protein JVU11DRAFT_13111 [Chiua virens]|nr:hypothetical protein JVU11DRAFT_13111 [Chiua virens]